MVSQCFRKGAQKHPLVMSRPLPRSPGLHWFPVLNIQNVAQLVHRVSNQHWFLLNFIKVCVSGLSAHWASYACFSRFQGAIQGCSVSLSIFNLCGEDLKSRNELPFLLYSYTAPFQILPKWLWQSNRMNNCNNFPFTSGPSVKATGNEASYSRKKHWAIELVFTNTIFWSWSLGPHQLASSSPTWLH